jgi:hypothetical protein
LLGIIEDRRAPLIIDEAPLLDLLQGTKTAETGVVIVEAAVSYARGLSEPVHVTHRWRSSPNSSRLGDEILGVHHDTSPSMEAHPEFNDV